MSLKQLVNEEAKRPLSYEMLRDLVPPWVKVVTYDSLAKFKTLKAALGGKEMIVCLYQVHDRAKNQPVEYFSSSGWSPGKEIAVTHSDPNIFKRLLGKNFIYNSKPLEKLGDQNTCWRWVIARCILGHLNLKSFQRLFNQRFMPRDGDDIITLMTLLLTAEKDLDV